MKMEVRSMTHHDFYIRKLYQMRNVLYEVYIYRNQVGVTSPI